MGRLYRSVRVGSWRQFDDVLEALVDILKLPGTNSVYVQSVGWVEMEGESYNDGLVRVFSYRGCVVVEKMADFEVTGAQQLNICSVIVEHYGMNTPAVILRTGVYSLSAEAQRVLWDFMAHYKGQVAYVNPRDTPSLGTRFASQTFMKDAYAGVFSTLEEACSALLAGEGG